MNKYLVVYQFSDGSIYNRILKAEIITEEVKAVKEFFDKSHIKNNVPYDTIRSIWRKWTIH